MQTIERKKGKKRLCSTNLKVHKNMKKAVICLIPFNESKNVKFKTSKEVKDAKEFKNCKTIEEAKKSLAYLDGIYEREDELFRKRFKNDLKCPKCGSFDLNKNGKTNKRQRYICKNCRTTFDERSFSPLSNTKLSLDTWLKYCQFMIEGGTIKYCAQKVGVSIPTSFFMRHRILDVINVGMYIGGGEFVHAANSRSGVKISSLSESWYAARYIGARRIVG